MERREYIINGSSGRSIAIDVVYKDNHKSKPVIIFSHGFKGFKDWGAFNQMSKYFAQKDFVFVKFNFSHNGTTFDDPLNFVDLSAFGNNNFCKELYDLSLVLDWVCGFEDLKFDIDLQNISLLGHSRGGAISILQTKEEKRIRKIVSWGSPSDLLNRLPVGKKLNIWKENKVAYIYNGRTKQNMPMYYQFYENCIQNIDKLDLHKTIINIKIPFLVVHGSDDSTVLVDQAYQMKDWNDKVELHIIDNSDHVFGAFHPYHLQELPKDLKEAINITIDFLKR